MLLSGLDLLPSPPYPFLFWDSFLATLNSRFLPTECWGFRDVWTSLGCQDIYFIGIVHVFCYHRQKKVHVQTVAFPDIYVS